MQGRGQAWGKGPEGWTLTPGGVVTAFGGVATEQGRGHGAGARSGLPRSGGWAQGGTRACESLVGGGGKTSVQGGVVRAGGQTQEAGLGHLGAGSQCRRCGQDRRDGVWDPEGSQALRGGIKNE